MDEKKKQGTVIVEIPFELATQFMDHDYLGDSNSIGDKHTAGAEKLLLDVQNIVWKAVDKHTTKPDLLAPESPLDLDLKNLIADLDIRLTNVEEKLKEDEEEEEEIKGVLHIDPGLPSGAVSKWGLCGKGGNVFPAYEVERLIKQYPRVSVCFGCARLHSKKLKELAGEQAKGGS